MYKLLWVGVRGSQTVGASDRQRLVPRSDSAARNDLSQGCLFHVCLKAWMLFWGFWAFGIAGLYAFLICSRIYNEGEARQMCEGITECPWSFADRRASGMFWNPKATRRNPLSLQSKLWDAGFRRAIQRHGYYAVDFVQTLAPKP